MTEEPTPVAFNLDEAIAAQKTQLQGVTRRAGGTLFLASMGALLILAGLSVAGVGFYRFFIEKGDLDFRLIAATLGIGGSLLLSGGLTLKGIWDVFQLSNVALQLDKAKAAQWFEQSENESHVKHRFIQYLEAQHDNPTSMSGVICSVLFFFMFFMLAHVLENYILYAGILAVFLVIGVLAEEYGGLVLSEATSCLGQETTSKHPIRNRIFLLTGVGVLLTCFMLGGKYQSDETKSYVTRGSQIIADAEAMSNPKNFSEKVKAQVRSQVLAYFTQKHPECVAPSHEDPSVSSLVDDTRASGATWATTVEKVYLSNEIRIFGGKHYVVLQVFVRGPCEESYYLYFPTRYRGLLESAFPTKG